MKALMLALTLACTLAAADKRPRVNAGSIYNTIPHIVNGGTWKTTIVVANMSDGLHQYTLQLRGDDGRPKSFEFVGRGSGSQFTGELPKGGIAVYETTGRGDLNQGWASVDSPIGSKYDVGVMAVFGTSGVPGRPDFEATVPGWHEIQYEGVLPFDNTGGYVTAVAMLNPGQFSSRTMPLTIYDEAGRVLKSDSITLAPGNKQSFALPERWPETAGRRGAIRLEGTLMSWSILGFRFHPGGAFTTINLLEP